MLLLFSGTAKQAGNGRLDRKQGKQLALQLQHTQLKTPCPVHAVATVHAMGWCMAGHQLMTGIPQEVSTFHPNLALVHPHTCSLSSPLPDLTLMLHSSRICQLYSTAACRYCLLPYLAAKNSTAQHSTDTSNGHVISNAHHGLHCSMYSCTVC